MSLVQHMCASVASVVAVVSTVVVWVVGVRGGLGLGAAVAGVVVCAGVEAVWVLAWVSADGVTGVLVVLVRVVRVYPWVVWVWMAGVVVEAAWVAGWGGCVVWLVCLCGVRFVCFSFPAGSR